MKPPTFDYSDTTFTLAYAPSNRSLQVVVQLFVRPPLHLEVNHPAKADQASHNPTMNGLFRYGHSLNRAKAGSLYTTFIPSLYQLHTPSLAQRQLFRRFTAKNLSEVDISKSLCEAFCAYPFSFYVHISLFVGTLHQP